MQRYNTALGRVFQASHSKFKNKNLYQPINDYVINRKIPFLGICLGMQLIATDSSENKLTKGFNWVNAQVRKIDSNNSIRLPHVGWNQIRIKKDSRLFSRLKIIHITILIIRLLF